ncbi:MAG: GFA family protein [Mesorhizobium sp.]|uniref:GFA family protein n=1 Tax=Mesorhizobium sp. TaxID=1871066 RepID=UPI00121C4109|nr:GFA family protein [Mesorhizobium sp.]TIP28734.1 MAG: GFA family protein [Mesorhizobium sp.]
MTTLYTGGCACGAVRYEAKAAPIFENHCQCRDCQKRSGTGHGSYLTFPSRADVTITGTTTDWRVAADNGNVKIHSFCPVCGTPTHLTYAAMPDVITVHAASLDDPGRFNPTVVTYGIRALPWDKMETGLTTFEKMPPG